MLRFSFWIFICYYNKLLEWTCLCFYFPNLRFSRWRVRCWILLLTDYPCPFRRFAELLERWSILPLTAECQRSSVETFETKLMKCSLESHLAEWFVVWIDPVVGNSKWIQATAAKHSKMVSTAFDQLHFLSAVLLASLFLILLLLLLRGLLYRLSVELFYENWYLHRRHLHHNYRSSWSPVAKNRHPLLHLEAKHIDTEFADTTAHTETNWKKSRIEIVLLVKKTVKWILQQRTGLSFVWFEVHNTHQPEELQMPTQKRMTTKIHNFATFSLWKFTLKQRDKMIFQDGNPFVTNQKSQLTTHSRLTSLFINSRK